MKHKALGFVSFATCLGTLVGATAWAAVAQPVAVSPGDPGATAVSATPVIADRCPTFNWGSVAGAEAYELAVYRLSREGEETAADPEAAIRTTLPGSAQGWTPALDLCLERGAGYAWSLRARGEDGAGPWSEASFFRVAAAPSALEVEQALAVLHAYLATTGETAGGAPPELPPPRGGSRRTNDPDALLTLLPDATAITGELPDTTGVGFGLHGVSNSSGDGSAGTVGQSTAASGDVAGVVGQVASPAGAAGVFDNTAGGDVLRGLVNGSELFRVDGTGQVSATGFSGDGSGLVGVAPAPHGHAGEDVTSGTVAEGRIDAAVARDSEILPTVLTGDGSGSTLDADLLDGNDASAFLPSATDNWVDEAGDTMTGTLHLNPAAGNALETTADVNLGGNLRMGGILFMHDNGGSTALGSQALVNNTTGIANTVVGGSSLFNNTEGSDNIAIGYRAGYNATTGNNNVLIANEGVAGEASTIRIGTSGTQTRAFLAGISNTPLSGIPVVVDAFGQLGTSQAPPGGGDATTLDGLDSAEFLRSNTDDSFTSGTLTTGTGTTVNIDGAFDASGATTITLPGTGIAGAGNGSGLDADKLDGNHASAFMPSSADNWVNETGDIMTGTLTLSPGSGNALTTTADVDLGGDILKNGDLFIHSNGGTAVGARALWFNTTGHNNVAVGSRALLSNTTGFENTASGWEALYRNVDGDRNTAMGSGALRNNTAGVNNTAVGSSVLFLNTTGDYNIAMGHKTLFKNSSGSRNTAFGDFALYQNTTGWRNVAVGNRSGLFATGSDNIFLSNEGTAGESGTIRIGTSGTHTRTFVAGVRGVATGVADAVTVLVDSQGQLGTISSSRRYKDDIRDMEDASSRLLKLRPVVFRYKEGSADGERPLRYGLIAEDVAEVFPELVVYDGEGRPETVLYHLLSPMLLNELQKQEQRLREQERRLREQERELQRLAVQLGALRAPP